MLSLVPRTGLLVYNRSLLISCHQALSTLAQLIVTVYSTKTLTNTWEISGRPRCVLVGTYGIKLQIWLMCALWHGVVYAGVGSGGCFKNTYELLNPRALKISILYKKNYLSMYGKDILCGISKGTFEIPHKISYTYIERCGFYSQVKI